MITVDGAHLGASENCHSLKFNKCDQTEIPNTKTQSENKRQYDVWSINAIISTWPFSISFNKSRQKKKKWT